MILVGTIIFALRKRTFWGSAHMYRRENEPPSIGAQIFATVVGLAGIVLGILVMFNLVS